MKANLRFTLPEEREEFEIACHAGEFHAAVGDFQRWLRDERKYVMALDGKTLDEVWEKFHQCVGELLF